MSSLAAALLRWVLGTKLNGLFPILPPGTRGANLVGGHIIDLAVAYFAQAPETVPLLQQDRLAWAMGEIAIHVSGSLLMTFVGLASWHWLKLH